MMIRNLYAEHVPFNRCRLDWFCEFCAYLKGQDMLKKYAGAWEPNGWYEMVLSLAVGVCPAAPEHNYMRDVLDAMSAAVKRLQKKKHMLGHIGWLELKVHQFYPNLIVTPHIHILLRCDCPPDRDAFAVIIAGEWTNRKLRAVPDLFLEPVKSEAHFYELLAYIKPVDLFGPYDSGYHAARAAGKLDQFHQDVREFFLALNEETRDFQERYIKKKRKHVLMPVTMRRFLYGGWCHGSSGHPLGLKEAVRRTKGHQDAVRAKVELAREVEEQSREEDESQPVE